MPFTFLPHQAPLLPLVGGRRRWDGVALVAGSIAPDLCYVTHGWGYGPLGIPLWFDGHEARNLLWVVALAVALTAIVRRVVMPVLPFAVPDVGGLGLRQYAAAARHRHPWSITVGSAAVGVASHVLWDAFTHLDGAVARAVPALTSSIAEVAGHPLRITTILQYGSSVLGGVAAVVLLRRLSGTDRIARGEPVPPDPLDAVGRGLCWGSIALGVVVGVAEAWRRSGTHLVFGEPVETGTAVVVMTFAWTAFAGVVVGCGLAALRARRSGDGAVTTPGRSTPAGADAPSRSSCPPRARA